MTGRRTASGWGGRRGATALTYGLVVGLVSLGALSAVTRGGESIDSLFSTVSSTLIAEGAGPDAPTAVPVASPSPSPSPAPSPSVDVGGILTPGNTSKVVQRNGWEARCLSWSGQTCTRPQLSPPTGQGPDTCPDYAGTSDDWYSLGYCGSTFNGGSWQNHSAEWFCYFATGSAAHTNYGDTGVSHTPLRSITHRYSESYTCAADNRVAFNTGLGGINGDSTWIQVGYCDQQTVAQVDCTAW